MTIQPGTRLGPYEIVAPIGAGGMGEVWRARDTRLDRDVAIKVLPPGFAQSATHRQRFEREAKAISQLNHPHVCTLFDVGEEKVAGSGLQESGGPPDGEDPAQRAPSTVLYLVMEYLEGEPLADRIRKSPHSPHDVPACVQQIAPALEEAAENLGASRTRVVRTITLPLLAANVVAGAIRGTSGRGRATPVPAATPTRSARCWCTSPSTS